MIDYHEFKTLVPPTRESSRLRKGAFACTLAIFSSSCGPPALRADRSTAPADGATVFHLNTPAKLVSGARFGKLESPTNLRATVLPGQIVLTNTLSTLTLTTTPISTDSAQDGTPDFLRLDSAADREAFRSWFTFIAEAQYVRHPLPREISDCAALIRYAYRETLSVHNDAWIDATHLPELLSTPGIAKYSYPYTPLGAALFRIRPGEYSPTDATDGTFAQFADAETLVRFNAHFIGKRMDRAQPGDILLYRQLDARLPFHTMIFLGPSQLERTRGPFVVYHTGPGGEIRRPLLDDLFHHPDPRWRPFEANSNFLGIYRWNILAYQS